MASHYSQPSSQSNKNKGGNEPWRNKERHYCPLCNVWLGNDRQSISLHENGKKHREALEQDLVARREHKVKKEKNEKELDSIFAQVNAAVGIPLASSKAAAVSNIGVTRPWERLPVPALTGNILQQQAPGSTQQVVVVGRNKRAPNDATHISSSLSITETKSTNNLEKVSPFDPKNVGHYELEGTTYLEGQEYASILEEGMPIQLWMGSIAANALEKRDLRNYGNWKLALLAKVVRKKGDDENEGRISCHVSYLQNSNDDHETLESNVHPSRIRLVLGSDPMIPSSIEEAQLALMGGEQTILLSNNNEKDATAIAADIDENTGLSGWSTTSIRMISSHFEQNQEKKRKREHEKELAEYKDKKEREIQARKMEEAKYANAHDSALGAYDVWSSSNSAVVAEGEGKATRSYKGVDITKEVQVEVVDTAKSLAKGRNVAFKKTVKRQNNVRRKSTDDD